MTKTPKVEIYNARNKQLAFRVRSKNGRIIVSGTGYNSFQATQKSVSALKEIMTSKFVVHDLRKLKAVNGKKKSKPTT